jgi:hypothetical protein
MVKLGGDKELEGGKIFFYFQHISIRQWSMKKTNVCASDCKNGKIGWGQGGCCGGKIFFFSIEFDQTVVHDKKHFGLWTI